MDAVQRKNLLRLQAIARRQALSSADRQTAARLLRVQANILFDHMLVEGDTVAAYRSMNDEIPTSGLLEDLLDRNMRVLLPLASSRCSVGWGWMGDRPERRTTSHRHGSSRFHHDSTANQLAPEALNQAKLILVPALAVDRHGRRLGRGGGWYDRSLVFRTSQSHVIAVCWPWEADLPELPHQWHDLPVDAVLTTEGIRQISS